MNSIKVKENESLVDSFERSIINNSLDIVMDFTEVGIDLLFEDGIIKEIPIIKTVYTLGKAAVSVRDKFFCQRVLAFIQEFNNGGLTSYDIEKHKIEISDDKKLKKELETVLQYIDLCTKTTQAQILARFYRGYINGEISWEVFEELSDINSRMILCDYDMIKTIVLITNYQNISDEEEPMINRLTSLGLTIDNRAKGSALLTEDFADNDGVVLSALGKVFGRYLNVSRRDINIKLERNSRYDMPKQRN